MPAAKKSRLLRGDIPKAQKIPTPSAGLNKSLGGGLLEGRIHSIWGEKASGKTTMAMHILAEAQRMGKICLWIDAEKTYDAEWAEACGVDIHELYVLRMNSVEGILSEVIGLIRKGEINFIVVDSLSSVFFDAYVTDPDNNPIGGFARASNYLVGKLLDAMDLDTTVILITHQANVSKGHMGFGLAAKMSQSVEHWNSSIIKLKKSMNKDEIRDDGSFKVLWFVQKSKQSVYPDDGHFYFVARQTPEAVEIVYDREEEVVHIALDEKILDLNGSWIEWHRLDKKIQGVNQLAQKLRDEPELYDALLEEVNGLQQVGA